jgi:hypothetical protein
VMGMLIAFPLQGYKAISITFSTLHIFLSYWFAIKFLNDIKQQPALTQKHALSLQFIKWSLFFMALSSLGPFALGGIMAKGLAGTSFYQLAIYFYLHFQYDGWFTFAVLGLLFWTLESKGILFKQKEARYFLWCMAIACLPAYALSTLWVHPPIWVYVLAGLAGALQLVALYFIIRIGLKARKQLAPFSKGWQGWLITFALGTFVLKLLLQTVSALPAIADMAYLVRNFTIGYLHLVFLGFISTFLLGWFARQQLIRPSVAIGTLSTLLFISGFVLSEAYVFAQPLMLKLKLGFIPFYQETLFFFSLLMPIAVLLLLWPKKQHA